MTILWERLRFYIQHSYNDLLVNGQRTLFGLFCIASGVAATVGLLTLGNMVQDTLTGSVQESNRADIRISPAFNFGDDEDTDSEEGADVDSDDQSFVFTPEDLTEIKQWFADEYDISVDEICADGSPVCITEQLNFSFTLVSNDDAGTGSISLVYTIDTERYPLYGSIETQDDQQLADAIDLSTYSDPEAAAEVVISQQIADELEIGVGDSITLLGTVDKEFVVSGVVNDRVEFGIANFAAALFGFIYVDDSVEDYVDASFFDDEASSEASLGYTTIFVSLSNTDDVDDINERFLAAFENEATTLTTTDLLEANELLADIITQFNSMMGLLALLIGGIGIVNTMLVIVRRRTGEIAVLKTLGLQPDEISTLFLVEAIMMGIIGSIVGIPFGFLVAFLTRDAVEAFVAQDLVFRITTEPIIIGLIVGTSVTTIFGLLPTLSAGQVRPATVLQPQITAVPQAGLVRSFIALLVVVIALSAVAQGMLRNLLTGDDIDFLQTVAQVALAIMGFLMGAVTFTNSSVTKGLLYLVNPIVLWAVALFALNNVSTNDESGTIALYLGVAAVFTVGWAAAWFLRNNVYVIGSLFLMLALPVLGIFLGRELPATIGIIGVFIISAIIYAVLWVIVWFVGSFFPGFGIVDLKIAMRAMLATKGRIASTLMAFIVGVFTLSLVVMLVTTIDKAIQDLLEDVAGGNLIAFVPPLEEDGAALTELETTLEAGLDGVSGYALVRSYQTELVSFTDVTRNQELDRDAIADEVSDNIIFGDGDDAAEAFFEQTQAVDARSLESNLPDLSLVEGRQLTPDDYNTPVMVVPNTSEVQALGISEGDLLTYVFVDSNDPTVQSRPITFEVVGIIQSSADLQGFGSLWYAPLEFQPTNEGVEVTPTSIAAVVEADEDKIDEVARTLRRLDNVFVFETSTINQVVSRVIDNFTSLPIVVSIVVLITGGVVIANSVALSMLERRREIAIMKAVGLQRRRVISMLLLENGIMGLIAGFIGVGLSALILLAILVGLFQSNLGEAIPYQEALLLMLICVLISMVAALVSVWGASSEKPLNVLRYE